MQAIHFIQSNTVGLENSPENPSQSKTMMRTDKIIFSNLIVILQMYVIQ